MEKIRCKWANGSPELMKYHDEEYGFKIYDDTAYFERLTLEIFQAGLSWSTILKKKSGFRKAFDNFDFRKISKYTNKKIDSLLEDKSIIRNKRKILATIHNAGIFVKIIKDHSSFNDFMDSIKKNNRKNVLKIFKDHFKFIGPLIVEEFMMSVGFWEIKHDKECFLNKTSK